MVESANHPKEKQNILGGLDEPKEASMKFPKKLRYKDRGRVLARIYKSSDNPAQPFNVYWRVRVDGKPRSRFKSFAKYGAALKFANERVAEIATGKLSATLSPKQVTDALAAIERLQTHFQATGRRFSLVASVSQFCEADAKGEGRLLSDMVDGFMTTVVSVKRKDLAKAVEEFALQDDLKTKAKPGQRPEIGKGYAKQKANMLRKFAGMYNNYAVADIRKEDIDLFIAKLPEIKSKRKNLPTPTTPKSRNHHRGALKQFLNWATRQDYLPQNHRLLEAESLRVEKNGHIETEFYTATELRMLLEASDEDKKVMQRIEKLRPVIAIGGLAGLRAAELLRLDWSDVWRVPGHIEITKGKAKTRQRRLVEICPVLAQWLAPYRTLTSGKVWDGSEKAFQENFLELCGRLGLKRKQNGLRHAFGSFHFALHANENLTAQQMGNSPSMVHGSYKGLATRKEAEEWFNVMPASKDNVIAMVTAQ